VHNEDGSIVVTYNGEIYNYKNLKRKLESLGHKFVTNSDTEVIVHSYEEFGDLFVKKLRGMFAFAIWDANKKRLLIGRDRLGIKPLYYYYDKQSFIFSSEIKSILQCENVKREVNVEALHNFLTLSYVPGPATMFSGIEKLLPGHVLAYELSKKKHRVYAQKYWEPVSNFNGKEPEAVYIRQVRTLFEEAIKIRLMSEVPLGVYLSGGIDSSAIVGVMSKFVENPIKTFTVGFGQSTDEFEYARIVAERFHTDHHEFIVEPDVSEVLPKVVWHLDEPIADPAIVPTYLISKLAKKYVTVALVGEGGDEAFAGYKKYSLLITAKRLANSRLGFFKKNAIPRFLMLLSRFLPESRTKDYAELIAEYIPKSEVEWYTRLCMDGFTEREKCQLYSETLLNKTKNFKTSNLIKSHFENDLHVLNKMILFDQKVWLPDRLLMKVDKMAMASSVEARVPFLDHKLVEFCNNLPPNLRMGKFIFKKAMSSVLPRIILKRKKRPFSNIPLTAWLKGELGEVGAQLLDSLSKREFFRHDRVLRLFSDIEKVKRNNQIWDLMVFEMWYELFIENDNVTNPYLSLNKFL
jgi:asparagine synthase (glutamine-hydrolysing)